MNTIKVFNDASKFLAGAEWSCAAADMVANFPACKFFLHYDDINDSDTVWTDRVGGITVTDPTGFIKDADGVARTGAVAPLGSPWPAPGRNDWCGIWTGFIDAAAHTIDFGDGYSGLGMSLSGGSGNYVTFNGTNYYNSDAIVNSYPRHALGLHVDLAANELRKTGANADGTLIDSSLKGGTGTGTLDQDWPTLTPQSIGIPATSGTSRVKTLALFVFTIPVSSDIMEAAMAWSAANPEQLYPGFAGKI